MLWYTILSFIPTFIATPKIAKFLGERGITGVDVHKEEKPDIPEMGGISVFIGIFAGFTLIFFSSRDLRVLSAFATIFVLFGVGVLDDLRGISQKTKVFLSLFAGLFLIPFVKDTSIDFLLLSIDFSYLYYLLVILGVAAASNSTNLLAGFNGEETGLGVISTLSLITISRIFGVEISQLILFPLLGVLLAFLKYNLYPAKVFPGDCGTLLIGGGIASAVILGKLEFFGFLVLLPQIIEFFLKFKVRFSSKSYGPTRVKDGILIPPKHPSLANLLSKRFKLNEKKLVMIIWSIGGFFGSFSIILAILFR
ncbi:MAG: multidrug transporter [Candidatus Methanofastidiosia archaeon]